MRAGQERAHADVHDEAAFDAVHHFARNRFLGFERRFDFFPRLAAQHFLVRHDGVPILAFARALHFDHRIRFGARNFRLREFRRRDQAFRLSAQVHDHAVFRIGDNPDLDHLARRSRFLFLVVLLHQLAHLFRTGSLLGCSRSFGIGRVRLRSCRRLRLFRCRRYGRRFPGAHSLGMFGRGRSTRFDSAFHRRICFGIRVVRRGFGFRCRCGGSRIGQVLVVGKHGCWPPEDYFAQGCLAAPRSVEKYPCCFPVGVNARRSTACAS